ncbi:MAG: transposase [Geminicoccaceae bacterium]|nr:transposase [Geminicoccaceae bacterium]
MLGPRKPRRLDEPIAVSLEDLVPADNFYRHLETKLDLSYVRDWTRERYAERGRPSIDPVVFFKLQLVMFFEGIRSERQLIATASLNLAHRWYLGYALDEALPDHSSLTRIRQRLGIDVFQRFFEQVVDLCQEAGLVWGRELYVDATKVEANADLDSLVPRFAYAAQTHVADLFADELAVAEVTPALDAEPPPGIVRLPIEPCAEPRPAGEDPPWRLLEERRLDPHRPAVGSYQCHQLAGHMLGGSDFLGGVGQGMVRQLEGHLVGAQVRFESLFAPHGVTSVRMESASDRAAQYPTCLPSAGRVPRVRGPTRRCRMTVGWRAAPPAHRTGRTATSAPGVAMKATGTGVHRGEQGKSVTIDPRGRPSRCWSTCGS